MKCCHLDSNVKYIFTCYLLNCLLQIVFQFSIAECVLTNYKI